MSNLSLSTNFENLARDLVSGIINHFQIEGFRAYLINKLC